MIRKKTVAKTGTSGYARSAARRAAWKTRRFPGDRLLPRSVLAGQMRRLRAPAAGGREASRRYPLPAVAVAGGTRGPLGCPANHTECTVIGLPDVVLICSAWRRPGYLEQTLASWTRVRGVGRLARLVVPLGPSEAEEQQREVIGLAAAAMGLPERVIVRPDSAAAACPPGNHAPGCSIRSRLCAASAPAADGACRAAFVRSRCLRLWRGARHRAGPCADTGRGHSRAAAKRLYARTPATSCASSCSARTASPTATASMRAAASPCR